ncbi:hypothetical protein WR25_20978 isoform G [Diploscapter pachys]|uniref:Uncharacterized protein n=2 Tax=Diploscapter pachys TaxID=2018661 RepID=A0A2A2K4K7_9BILA|nr:hypothetical protein WR25_20978 isoform E [Diploscapter pachys]PAV68805.1 hypothetical protein WR25_20978 isoform G [Diploscapter pachys]
MSHSRFVTVIVPTLLVIFLCIHFVPQIFTGYKIPSEKYESKSISLTTGERYKFRKPPNFDKFAKDMKSIVYSEFRDYLYKTEPKNHYAILYPDKGFIFANRVYFWAQKYFVPQENLTNVCQYPIDENNTEFRNVS